MLMQQIWSEIVATLKSQYDGLKDDSDGVERPRLAFIVLCLSWVSGHPHKMKLSRPYRDLYIMLSHVKLKLKGVFFGKKTKTKPLRVRCIGAFNLLFISKLPCKKPFQTFGVDNTIKNTRKWQEVHPMSLCHKIR